MPEIHMFSNEYVDSHLTRILDSFGDLDTKTLFCEGPIVDLGCGDGTLLYELKRKFNTPKVVGVDRDPDRKYDNVEYVQANLKRSGLPNNFAKVVVSTFIIDYIGGPGSYNGDFTFTDLFKEVDRLLVPGGIYIPIELFSKEDKNNLLASFNKEGYRVQLPTKSASSWIIRKELPP